MNPDGYIIDKHNLVVFGDQPKDGVLVSAGATIELTDVGAASNRVKNSAFWDNVDFLKSLYPEIWVQVQTVITHDYMDVLDRYNVETQTAKREGRGSRWGLYCRDTDRYGHYRAKMYGEELRRVRTVMFVTKAVEGRGGSKNDDEILAVEAQLLDNIFRSAESCLNNSRVTRLEAEDLRRLYLSHFNPSVTLNELYAEQRYFPDHTIRQNCDFSPGFPMEKATSCFRKDGFYHNIIRLSVFPEKSGPESAQKLLECIKHNARITQTVYTQTREERKKREEHLLGKAKKEQSREIAKVNDVTIEMHEQRLLDLQRGQVMPHIALTIVHHWSSTIEGLYQDGHAIKTLLRGFGCKYEEPALKEEARALYFATMPGYIATNRKGQGVYANSQALSGFLPFGTQFMGEHEGQVLYEGEDGNLTGMTFFAGDRPQHTFITGSSGFGKSLLVADILSQTDPFYDYNVIVDRGGSHEEIARLMGCSCVRIGPNSRTRINYFDTLGGVLTPMHVQSAVMLCAKMGGYGDTEQGVMSMIEYYINRLYDDFIERWNRRNRDKSEHVRRFAYIVAQMMKQYPDESIEEVYSRFREIDHEVVEKKCEGLSNSEVTEWLDDPTAKNILRAITFAFFERNEFPLHSGLVESMRTMPSAHHIRERVSEVADRLASWCGDVGANGGLVDGFTNANFGGKGVHIELGDIPKDNQQMLGVAYYMVTGFARQKILTMPRGIRKRIIFEEIGIFAQVPQGAHVMSDAASQFSKFNCLCIFIGQQYGQISSTSVKSIIVGNCINIIVLGQKDASDTASMARDLGLPSAACEAVRAFRRPVDMKRKEDKYTKFVFHRVGERAGSGVCVNRVSPQMLFAAESGGRTFDERKKRLDAYPDRFEGLLRETKKNTEGIAA